MIYVVKNLVENYRKQTSWKDAKVFAVDDEMAVAVSRALCHTNGYKVLDQLIVEKR